jgi:hypothetical protein
MISFNTYLIINLFNITINNKDCSIPYNNETIILAVGFKKQQKRRFKGIF